MIVDFGCHHRLVVDRGYIPFLLFCSTRFNLQLGITMDVLFRRKR